METLQLVAVIVALASCYVLYLHTRRASLAQIRGPAPTSFLLGMQPSNHPRLVSSVDPREHTRAIPGASGQDRLRMAEVVRECGPLQEYLWCKGQLWIL